MPGRPRIPRRSSVQRRSNPLGESNPCDSRSGHRPAPPATEVEIGCQGFLGQRPRRGRWADRALPRSAATVGHRLTGSGRLYCPRYCCPSPKPCPVAKAIPPALRWASRGTRPCRARDAFVCGDSKRSTGSACGRGAAREERGHGPDTLGRSSRRAVPQRDSANGPWAAVSTSRIRMSLTRRWKEGP